MSFPALGPGKTAPKLLHDFKLFDPLHADAKILNDQRILATDRPTARTPAQACRHDYATKHGQSTLPPEDLRSRDAVEPYKAALVCKKCRIHADVVIDLAGCLDPCPNSDYPLHHFQRLPQDDVEKPTILRYAWSCSGQACNARLWIDYTMPRLNDEAVRLLTQTDVLNARFHDVVARDPEREGMRQATPMDVLTRLRRYMADANKPQHTKREFPANNKRFMEAFGYNGSDCQHILKSIGFKYAVSEEGDPMWILPDPGKNGDLFTTLEDYDFEIRALMDKRARHSLEVNTAAEIGWPSAQRDLDRTLGAQGYHRFSSLRSKPSLGEEEPCFAGLGSLSDFSDGLVEFAYDRQVAVDATNQPLYLGHLQEIAQSRASEQLQTKVVTLESMGYLSLRELNEAYQQLGVSSADNDQRILNLFQAVLPDSSMERQSTLRSMLSKIATHRDSQVLRNAATQTLETYEEALQWLGRGADPTISDEFITTLYAMKVQDNPLDEEVGRKAVSIIAKARQSKYLESFVSTGKMDEYQMSVEDACEYLGLKKAELDNIADSLEAVFVSARDDRPNEQTEKAIKTISQHMEGGPNSGTIEGPHTLENWPVGLTSHGNTCYLNSILQYYFSIRTLRDIVIKFEEEKLKDPDLRKPPGLRVGHVEQKPIEIAAGIKFAESLKYAFEAMITSPSAKVRPDDVLVCRTFLQPDSQELLKVEDEQAQEQERVRRLTGSTAERPSPSSRRVESLATDVITEEPEESVQTQSEGDEAKTVADTQTTGSMQDVKSSEGESASKDRLSNPIDEQKPPLPARKPAVRRESAVTKSALLMAEEKARMQHDVAEVHDNIMCRLRAGIEPLGKEADNEQYDKLRAIFAIKKHIKTFKDPATPKVVEEVGEFVQLAIPQAPTDIYTALEEILDPLDTTDGVEEYHDLVTLPDILQINISRNTYAITDSGYQPYKALHPVNLEDDLYLDRFHDQSHPETAQRRRKCWAGRKRLAELRREQKLLIESPPDVDMNAAMAATESAKYLRAAESLNSELEALGLGGIDIDPDLISALERDGENKAQRISEIASEIQQIEQGLNGAFADLKSCRYRLHAVFVHRGNTGSGHYWIYIHDFENDVWRCYNDETVTTERNLAKILSTSNTVDGTPTYVSYVKDETKGQVIQPLCRKPIQKVDEVVDSHDSVMANSNDDSKSWQAGDDVAHTAPKMIAEGGNSDWDEKRDIPEHINW